MLAADLEYALSPVRFAAACGIALDPWQAQFIEGVEPRVILNVARQCGKSTSAALLALYKALYEPGSLILMVSPSLRQSVELFLKLQTFYRAFTGAKPDTVTDNTTTLQLRNESRVIALPSSEDRVRGYSAPQLIIVDEASRVTDTMIDSLRPMFAVSGGRFVVMSTPAGRRGFFFREWTYGKGWKKVYVDIYDCPRVSTEFIDTEKRDLAPLIFEQEYLGRFVSEESSVFASELVEAAFDGSIQPLFV